jgi:hypothetical protein
MNLKVERLKTGVEYKPREKPRNAHYRPFGIFIINLKMLEKNILLVKYPTPKNLGPVPKLRQTPISREMTALLNDLLYTGQVNSDIQKVLKNDEPALLNTLMRLSRLGPQLNFQPYRTSVDDFVHRFELLKAGFIAGNNEVAPELEDLINVLSSNIYKKISKEDAQELIDCLVVV